MKPIRHRLLPLREQSRRLDTKASYDHPTHRREGNATLRTVAAMLLMAAACFFPVSGGLTADETKQSESLAELKKFQGLWQTSPGGMEHRGGHQVVRTPYPDGPCFFIYEDQLIWLDKQGKPTGKRETLKLDPHKEPKRITLTPFTAGKEGKALYGIYIITGDMLTLHLGLDGGPAPKQFLVINKPVEGVDGEERMVRRKTLQGK